MAKLAQTVNFLKFIEFLEIIMDPIPKIFMTNSTKARVAKILFLPSLQLA
jgi:hypothetical protein